MTYHVLRAMRAVEKRCGREVTSCGTPPVTTPNRSEATTSAESCTAIAVKLAYLVISRDELDLRRTHGHESEGNADNPEPALSSVDNICPPKGNAISKD